LFWLDERGEPAAAVLATDFGHSVQHDVLIMIKDRSVIRLAWRTAIARASQTRGAGHEFPVHPADTTGAAERQPGLRGADGTECRRPGLT
jgi:hypothetical protein